MTVNASAFWIRANGRKFPVRWNKALSWEIYVGTQGKARSYSFHPDDAAALLATDGPVEIVIQKAGKGNRPKVFKNLYIVDEAPPEDVFCRTLMISDQRWYWKQAHFEQDYNRTISSTSTESIAGAAGGRRAVSPQGTPLSIKQITDDKIFASYSLNPPNGRNAKAWKAKEVLEDVLTQTIGPQGSAWRFSRRVQDPFGQQVQDTFIEGDWSRVIGHALALNIGLVMYQDPSGIMVIDNGLPGAADKVIDAIALPSMALVTSPGYLRRLDHSRNRAVSHASLFMRELGVRFDYEAGVGVNVQREDPYLFSTLTTTDPLTALPDGSVVGMGTRVPDVTLIEAWNTILSALRASGSLPGNIPALTLANIRRYWGVLHEVYVRGSVAGIEPNVQVQRWMSSIKNGFRQEFQMNPVYAHSARAIIPKMLGIIDPESGTEADAHVYSHFATRPSALAFHKLRQTKTRRLAINNLNGRIAYFRSRSAGALTADSSRAPALVTQLTAQGTFRLDFRKDPLGTEAEIVPSILVESTIPGHEYGSSARTFRQAALSPEHMTNVILTMIPGGNENRLERIDVTESEAYAKLKMQPKNIRPGQAPTWEKKVGANLMPAKYPYRDSRHDEIKKALGIIPGVPQLGDALNLEIIRDIAEANAAHYYLTKIDHYGGQQSIPLTLNVLPYGEIRSVTHTVAAPTGDGKGGAVFTTITAGKPDFEGIDPSAFFKDSTRRVVLRAVNPTGA